MTRIWVVQYINNDGSHFAIYENAILAYSKVKDLIIKYMKDIGADSTYNLYLYSIYELLSKLEGDELINEFSYRESYITDCIGEDGPIFLVNIRNGLLESDSLIVKRQIPCKSCRTSLNEGEENCWKCGLKDPTK